jgi:molecular chaperone GrpE (heat shock protein)
MEDAMNTSEKVAGLELDIDNLKDALRRETAECERLREIVQGYRVELRVLRAAS